MVEMGLVEVYAGGSKRRVLHFEKLKSRAKMHGGKTGGERDFNVMVVWCVSR